MKILLIGSTGLIGAQLLRDLTEAGHDVITLNRSESNTNGIHNFMFVFEIISNGNFDVVISTAWTTSHENYRISSQNKDYSISTFNLYQVCAAAGVKHFVAFGSSAEYGNSNLACHAGLSIEEPVDDYGKAKLETFRKIDSYSTTTSTIFSWLRVFQVFGIGQTSSRLIPALLNSNKNPLELKNPNGISDWIYLPDISNALIFVINNQIKGAIDVGTSIATSNQELVESLSQLLGRTLNVSFSNQILNKNGLVVSPKSHLFSLGWAPVWNLSQGLEQIVGIWRD